jgi:hypothetical protein
MFGFSPYFPGWNARLKFMQNRSLPRSVRDSFLNDLRHPCHVLKFTLGQRAALMSG